MLLFYYEYYTYGDMMKYRYLKKKIDPPFANLGGNIGPIYREATQIAISLHPAPFGTQRGSNCDLAAGNFTPSSAGEIADWSCLCFGGIQPRQKRPHPATRAGGSETSELSSAPTHGGIHCRPERPHRGTHLRLPLLTARGTYRRPFQPSPAPTLGGYPRTVRTIFFFFLRLFLGTVFSGFLNIIIQIFKLQFGLSLFYMKFGV
jgi:hypothetical protein